jgi:Putative lumazine-binding
MFKKSIFLFTLILSIHVQMQAQSAQDSVRTVVKKLFTAMKSSDSSALVSLFTDQAILQTIFLDKEGKTGIRTDAVSDFVTSIGKLPKDAADERIEFGNVSVDGALASVWTPYQFYFNGKFSHCGANSFQLVRINGTWKIHYLIDTRRRINCE